MTANTTPTRTSDLIGPALDWAVATCEGFWYFPKEGGPTYVHKTGGEWFHSGGYSPSTNWSLAGPIIERERMCIDSSADGSHWLSSSRSNERGHLYKGNTPLVAAMRSHVACKLGDVVEIPNELLPNSFTKPTE